MIRARWCRPAVVAPWPNAAALDADAAIAPMYMKVRSRPAAEPMRAASAWWYSAFWLARPLRPCGRPMSTPTPTSSHTAVPPPANSRATQASTCRTPPASSLPRNAECRPVSVAMTIALADRGSSTRPADDAPSPRPSSSHCVYPYRKAYEVT